MSLNRTLTDTVANLIGRTLKAAELTEDVTIKFYTGEGTLDVENDTREPTFSDLVVTAVITRPSQEESAYGVVIATDAKLIVPGKVITQDINPESDRVVRANGDVWMIRTVRQVPGNAAWFVYIYRT